MSSQQLVSGIYQWNIQDTFSGTLPESVYFPLIRKFSIFRIKFCCNFINKTCVVNDQDTTSIRLRAWHRVQKLVMLPITQVTWPSIHWLIISKFSSEICTIRTVLHIIHCTDHNFCVYLELEARHKSSHRPIFYTFRHCFVGLPFITPPIANKYLYRMNTICVCNKKNNYILICIAWIFGLFHFMLFATFRSSPLHLRF